MPESLSEKGKEKIIKEKMKSSRDRKATTQTRVQLASVDSETGGLPTPRLHVDARIRLVLSEGEREKKVKGKNIVRTPWPVALLTSTGSRNIPFPRNTREERNIMEISGA